jgi:hypothetical protein
MGNCSSTNDSRNNKKNNKEGVKESETVKIQENKVVSNQLKKDDSIKQVRSERNADRKVSDNNEKKPVVEIEGELQGKEEVKVEEKIQEEEVDIKVDHSSHQLVSDDIHQKVFKNAVSSFNTFTKTATKYENFENAFVKELNHSALAVTKYFKNQRPHTSSEPFTDPVFPPTWESIFGLEADGSPIDKDVERRAEAERDFQIDADDIVWLRPTDIFGSEFAMFEDNIEFDDVRQGSIGNCYFMASISALTENPQIIAEIYRHHDVQGNGCYEICMKIDGLWNVVMLDDFIPCSRRTNRPIFANPKNNELWAILLEKAWAKINGGYINTVAGMASEVIECLTNFAYEYNNIASLESDEDRQALWERIVVASNNDYIMTTALPPREGAKEIGLVVGHEYTLIEGKEETINGENIKLLKVRNPWGSMKYTGKWGANWEGWTDEAQEKFDYKNTYDGEGEFFIDYADFLYFFADVDICQIEDRVCMKHLTVSYEDSKKTNLYQLRLFEKAKVTISLYKPYYRFVKELPTDWTVTQQIMMAKLKDDDKEALEFTDFIGAVEGQNDCTITKVLEPGFYYFYANVNYASAKDRNSEPLDLSILEKLSNTICIFSTEFFGFNLVEDDCNMAMFYKMALSYSRSQELEVVRGIKMNVQNNFMKSEYYYLYSNNFETGKALKFSFDFSSMVGLHPITPIDENKKCIFVLQPGQENVIVLGCSDMYEPHGIGYGLGYKSISQDETSVLMPVMTPIKDFNLKSRNILNYNWIYKKGDVDYKNILKKIDVSDAAFKFFKKKYPKEIEAIEQVPKLENHDQLELDVQDRVDFGDGDSYLGEWKKVDGSLVMYGRGYACLSGNTFIGQFENHAFSGVGKMILSSGDIISGIFKAFNPKGKCQYTHNDGKAETRNYGE